MHGNIARIEKLENGYEVEVCDPATEDKNSRGKGPYVDPWKGYAFKTTDEVVAFLTKVLGKLAPVSDSEEYAESFNKAVSEKE